MSTQAWPFLVSRNLYLDYRTIVAPDFICREKIQNLLARVAEGNLTDPGSAISRTVHGSKADDFTIIFRVVRATKKEISIADGDEVLKDQFGREIDLIEGIVLRGVSGVSIPQNVLDQAHLQLTESYRQFWDSLEPPSVIPSSSFSWTLNGDDSFLKIKKLESFRISSKELPRSERNDFPVTMVIILALMVLLVIYGASRYLAY